MNFYENSYFYHFSMPGGPGTRPEALGTPGIDSTSIKKIDLSNFFLKFHTYFAYKRTLDGLKSRFDPLEL